MSAAAGCESDSGSEWEKVTPNESDGAGTDAAKRKPQPADDDEEYRPIVPQTREKAPLVNYAYLPRIEFGFYCSVVVFLVIYMWYLIYNMSWELHNKTGLWRGFRTFGIMTRTEHPVFGPRLRDDSNWEWRYFKPLVPRLVLGLLAHSTMFNALEYVVGTERPLALQVLRTALSVPINVYVYGWWPVLTTVPQGLFIYTITRATKSQLCLWASVLPVMYMVMHSNYLDGGDPFLPMLLGSYKCLMYISFGLEYLRGNVHRRSQESFTWGLLRMLHFAFYMPYGASLIVTYAQFEHQLIERTKVKRNWKALAWYAVRLVFWYNVLEAALHYFYFEMILHSERTLRKIGLHELVTLGAAAGEFFHLKYVLIFGIPRLFALIDGMQPPPPPICTSRVVLFSNIWRNFDVGLYVFFKEYIFLPICRPSFSLWRKLLGVAMAYSFVLHWHGYTRANVVWIVFNLAEMAQEAIAKTLYSMPAVRQWREAHIGDVMFRRIIALLQVCPYAFSLYSNFYFLGGGRSGWVFVDRVFWGETVTLQYPFPLLVACGYCFTHVIMTLDQYMYDRKRSPQHDAPHSKSE